MKHNNTLQEFTNMKATCNSIDVGIKSKKRIALPTCNKKFLISLLWDDK